MKTVIVENNVVINIIESTTEHNANIQSQHQHIEVINESSPIQIGATWDGTDYTNPAQEEQIV